jgi:predicted phosphodiesterase
MTEASQRFALLSDVHGNLAGLRAVAAALEAEGPFEAVVVAGDHLQGGPCPHEVWALLHDLGWTLVLGNEDEALVAEVPQYLGTDHRRAYLAQHEWYRRVLSPAFLGDLGALPAAWRTSTPLGDLLVVHSSPRSTTDRSGGLHNTAAEVAAAYGGTGAAAIAFGHYHRSFVRPVSFALLVNVASVGLPLDGRDVAAYTILSVVDGSWVVEQRHVPYDPAPEEAIARQRGLPLWVPDGP